MKKVIYLPLDERPCNAAFPIRLFGDTLRMVTPPKLGSKKSPAAWENLRAFLDRETADADGLVLSMDMLLYGGLVPSRLHHLTMETARERLDYVREIRRRNPNIVIYAFQCIMRCPNYSSSDEEPDYYADYGCEIFLLGEAQHRYRLGLSGREEMDRLYSCVPGADLKDYLARREFNLNMNLAALDLVGEGVIDELVLPQDDCSRYGFTAMDQERIRERISEKRLGARVLMYPGADELGLTVTSRMALHFEGKRPRVYVRMASENAVHVVPPFEDRPLGETIKYHLISAGCRMATCLSEADIVLGVTFPGCAGKDVGDVGNPGQGYTVDRTLIEFVLFLQDALEEGRIVTIADNAFANAGDPELISLLDQLGLLDRLHGYAGWNTSSNTMGTSVAEGVHAFLRGMTAAHRDFLALRYVEDAGYCGKVRQQINQEELPQLDLDYFHADAPRGKVSALVQSRLEEFIRRELPSIADRMEITDVYMPWVRMFEVGLTVKWHDEAKQ